MNLKKFIKELWVDEKAPNPITKLSNNYNQSNDSPEISFERKKYLYSISPQIQVGVTGYARLLDLANIQINTDNEKAKKLIEDWMDMTDFKTKLESMGNTFLVCGNSILEKLDGKNIQDVVEVDMTSIVGKRRDDYGKTLYYTQQTREGQKQLLDLSRYIEFNLTTISRSLWSPCIFESAAIPRMVGNRNTKCLIELVVGVEDAMSTIILNNAYPEVYYTFEGANEEQLKKETEKIRKKKPGDRVITTKAPKIELFEAKGQSAYVDYIKYLYDSLSTSVKFPVGIILGDFTSRASSDTSADQPSKIASAIKRYLGNKLKQELFDPILTQNGIDPRDTNLQVTFGTQETVPLTPADVLSRFEKKMWSIEEAREFDKDNSGVDLFDDDIMSNDTQNNNDMIPVDDKKGGFVMKPRVLQPIKKEKLKEGFGDTVIYKLDYGHDKTDVCDDYSDEVYELGSVDIPTLPDDTHPNCKCYFEDEETGEYLGQDPESALSGDIQTPESFKEIRKELESIKNMIKKPIDETITKRADEIKDQFYQNTIDKAVKESLKDVIDEIHDTIEEKKFNKKVKTEILETLAKLTGENNGT